MFADLDIMIYCFFSIYAVSRKAHKFTATNLENKKKSTDFAIVEC